VGDDRNMKSDIAENVTPKSIPDAMNKASKRGRNSPSAPHANDVTNAYGIHAGSRRAAHSLVASMMTATEIAPAAIGYRSWLTAKAILRTLSPSSANTTAHRPAVYIR